LPAATGTISTSRGRGRDAAVTTAAAEKVYRALGPAAEIAVKLAAVRGAGCRWLPQETILFDRARLHAASRSSSPRMPTLLMAEAVVFGRSAMGEAVTEGAFTDRWRVRRDGRLCLPRRCGSTARSRGCSRTGGGRRRGCHRNGARGPGDLAMAERVRAQTFCGEVGISAWNGLAVARLCAKDDAGLRRDLTAVITALGGTLPRLWLN
jgi:urease accessory protein